VANRWRARTATLLDQTPLMVFLSAVTLPPISAQTFVLSGVPPGPPVDELPAQMEMPKLPTAGAGLRVFPLMWKTPTELFVIVSMLMPVFVTCEIVLLRILAATLPWPWPLIWMPYPLEAAPEFVTLLSPMVFPEIVPLMRAEPVLETAFGDHDRNHVGVIEAVVIDRVVERPAVRHCQGDAAAFALADRGAVCHAEVVVAERCRHRRAGGIDLRPVGVVVVEARACTVMVADPVLAL